MLRWQKRQWDRVTGEQLLFSKEMIGQLNNNEELVEQGFSKQNKEVQKP